MLRRSVLLIKTQQAQVEETQGIVSLSPPAISRLTNFGDFLRVRTSRMTSPHLTGVPRAIIAEPCASFTCHRLFGSSELRAEQSRVQEQEGVSDNSSTLRARTRNHASRFCLVFARRTLQIPSHSAARCLSPT